MNLKKTLKNIGSKQPLDYILTPYEMKLLNFSEIPKIDTSSPYDPKLYSLSTTIISSTSEEEICEVTLLDQSESIIFNEIVQTKGNFNKNIDKLHTLEEAHKILIPIFLNNIIVGYDISNDLNRLRIPFKLVIDVVMLYPHRDFLPYKRPLKELIYQNLHYDIQEKGSNSLENALSLIRLAKYCIYIESKGKTIICILEQNEGIFTELTELMVYKYLEFEEKDIFNIYLRGSRSIGTNGTRFDGSLSDWDIVIVLNTNITIIHEHLKYGNIDVAGYDYKTFTTMVKDNLIWTLECVFAPKNCILKETFDFRKIFKINLGKLRNSVSYDVSKQISKGKRHKDDLYKGFKAIFISLRFYYYGIQLVKSGNIADIKGVNDIWSDMLKKKDELTTWEEVYSYYKPKLAEFRKEFTDLCPYQGDYSEKNLIKTTKKRNINKNPVEKPSNHEEEKKYEENDENELETVKYIKIHGVNKLCNDYKIQFKRHAKYPNLVQLHYQVYADFLNKIPRECRGLILNEDKNYEVVSMPFYKFFDYTDKNCAFNIDWDSAKVYDKFDGSTATLYYYNDRWHISSSSIPNGSSMMCFKDPVNKTTMEQLFWSIFKDKAYKMPENTEFCYIFEVICKNHVIVIEYAENDLILIGVRNVKTLKEEVVDMIGEKYGWNYIKPLKIAKNLNEVINDANALDAEKKEGFVICDKNFQRIKVKNPEYLRKNWMFPICPSKSHMNERHILYVIRENEGENFVKYCPEWKIKYMEIKEKYDNLMQEITKEYDLVKNIKDNKEFALIAKKSKNQGVLFALRHGSSLEEFCCNVNIKYLEDLLGIVNKEFKFT